MLKISQINDQFDLKHLLFEYRIHQIISLLLFTIKQVSLKFKNMRISIVMILMRCEFCAKILNSMDFGQLNFDTINVGDQNFNFDGCESDIFNDHFSTELENLGIYHQLLEENLSLFINFNQICLLGIDLKTIYLSYDLLSMMMNHNEEIKHINHLIKHIRVQSVSYHLCDFCVGKPILFDLCAQCLLQMIDKVPIKVLCQHPILLTLVSYDDICLKSKKSVDLVNIVTKRIVSEFICYDVVDLILAYSQQSVDWVNNVKLLDQYRDLINTK